MDKDQLGVGVKEVARILKFEDGEVVGEVTSEDLDDVFAKSAPGYNLEYARAILIGLQQKPIYGGTVPYEEKERRRARNRRAKAARKRSR